MAVPVQTPPPVISTYQVPPGMLQASKVLTLKREIDILCATKAQEILHLAEEYPLEPAAYNFTAKSPDKDLVQASNEKNQGYTDILSINLEKLVPDYANFSKHMYMPLEVLGVERQHYYKAIKAADFLHYPEAVEFYSKKAALDLEQQFQNLIKKTAAVAASERGFLLHESHPIFSNERYAQSMLDELKTLEFDVIHCPFSHVAKKVRSPILLWEMQRRGLESVNRHAHYEEYRRDWDQLWHFYSRRNQYNIGIKADESNAKAPDFWQKLFLERFFDSKIDNYTARISIPNLVLLLATGHLLTNLKLNVGKISTLELSRLFFKCPNLDTLTLSSYNAEDIGALSILSKLQKLTLKSNDVPSYVDREQIPPSVVDVVVEECDFDDLAFTALFKNKESLKTLSLIRCPNLTDAGLKAMLRECRTLRSFTLIDCPKIDGTGLSTLCTKIERIHIEKMRFKKDSFDFFLKTHVASLRELNLINIIHFGCDSLSSLYASPPLNLEILKIEGQLQLSISKLKKVLTKLSNLRFLTIRKNEWINDHFVKSFQESILPTMPHFVSADFDQCPNISKRLHFIRLG